MSIKERLTQLISSVEKHKFLEAIQEYYAEDASMQENNGPPRTGMENLLANERQVLQYFKVLHVARAESYLVDGDRSAVNWIFEFTNPEGRRFRMNEIAYQQWSDGKIVFEKFYYDPAQRRIEVDAQGRPVEVGVPA